MQEAEIDPVKRAEWIGHDAAVKEKRGSAWRWMIAGLVLLFVIFPALSMSVSQTAPEARSEYVLADEMRDAALARGDTKAADDWERRASEAAGRDSLYFIISLIGLAGMVVFVMGAWKRLRSGRTSEEAMKAVRAGRKS